MGQKFKEQDLREKLRTAWGAKKTRLVWAEPKVGSTVGLPDTLICMPPVGLFLPVELKVWDCTNLETGQFKTPVRPAQRQFHYRTYRNDGLSAILAGVRLWDGKELVGLKFVAIPGGFVLDMKHTYFNREFVSEVEIHRPSLERLFNSNEFWNANG